MFIKNCSSKTVFIKNCSSKTVFIKICLSNTLVPCLSSKIKLIPQSTQCQQQHQHCLGAVDGSHDEPDQTKQLCKLNTEVMWSRRWWIDSSFISSTSRYRFFVSHRLLGSSHVPYCWGTNSVIQAIVSSVLDTLA
jgi:hypothetical protein